MRLLLIEDNPKLIEYVTLGLRKEGFVVDAARTAAEGEAALATGAYDIVVLDLGLPDRDGLTILADMRQRGDATFVLVLTARDKIDDRVRGLTEGADDYLVKPFALAELVARLRALQRRPAQALEMVLARGNVRFDPQSRQVEIAGSTLALSRRETDALEFLMRRTGRVISKTALEEAIYAESEELASNAIEVLVHRLRKRIQAAGADISIVTLRGIGYMLSEQAAA